MKYIKLNLENQKYINEIILKNSKILSGRKNYKSQYERVLKNILLAKKFKIYSNKKISSFFKKTKFKIGKKYIKLFI